MFNSVSDVVPGGAVRPFARPGQFGRIVWPVAVAWALMAGSASAYAAAPASEAPAPGSKLGYNRDIRPLLSENCFACHGPDKNQRKAKLRLDVREAALEKQALVPGRPDESELVRRLYTTNTDEVMPPPESHKKLTPEQKERLKRWVAEGAEYEPHWAYLRPQRPEVPPVGDRQRVRNPIDAFILHALEAKQIQPSPEADKRTLLRRLSLDLIGLPPTPEETADFLRDSSSTAYERQVDRLLRSPHFGERMAVSWLDVARFADTVGYHGDQNVNVFPYRDYVINAFNRNEPFDQFTIEQLAGDLLPQPTAEQRTASGFNRLNMMTREGGAQPKEYLAKYAADRVRTVSTAWLGSTMGCCECHDHKFDPFSTRDFYSMEAFFADIKQWGVYSDYDYTPNPDLKGWSNDHPFPPEIEVDSPYLARRLAQLQRQMNELRSAVAVKFERGVSQPLELDGWRRFVADFVNRHSDGWDTPAAAVWLKPNGTNSTPAAGFTANPDGSILFTGKASGQTELVLLLSSGWLSAIRVELLPRAAHEGSIVRGKDPSTSIALEASLKPLKGKESRLAFYHAEADHKEKTYSNGFEVPGVKDRWKTSAEHRKSPQTAVWLLDPPRKVRAGDALILKLGKTEAGCVRVSVSPFAAADPVKSAAQGRWLAALPQPLLPRDKTARDRLGESYFLSTGWDIEDFGRYKKLYRDLLECRGGKSPVVVTAAREPMVTRVLPRGNWQAENGDIVQPAVPHFLPQIPNPYGRRLTRLDLAKWLVSQDNPLTGRTIMNRLWKQFFGTGISAVVDDLGAQGEWPVHPELLDWLAREFGDSGWNLKHMVKLMVMSSTYRQSSNPRPEIKELDPNNRWLASQTPRRLEAEFVRDNALFIAGLLNLELGGPSVHPYQPAGYYANLQFPDRDYYPDLDRRQYRRGVYTHWQRTFLQPMLANFDAPSREECVAARNVSNTPQQALTLLNDPTFVEAARVFAEKVMAGQKNDDQRLELIFQDALERPVKPEERASLEQFLSAQREYYRANPGEAKKLMRVGMAPEPNGAEETELAVWLQVCRVVLNLHETITRY